MRETVQTQQEAGKVILVVLTTQQLLMAYDSTAMNVAISDIVQDLHTTLTGVQSAIALYALVMASLMITGSKLGIRHKHTRIFMLGALVYGTGALVTALSPNLPVMLFGWSLLEGIGAVLIFPAILSIVTLSFTGAARTRALSIVGAMAGVGAALGPILGGVITKYLSWRLSFLMETVITAVVMVLMRRAVEPKGEEPEHPLDVVGVVLSALGLGLVVLGTLLATRYGVVTARQNVVVLDRTVIAAGDISPTGLLVGTGLVVLVLFGWWERRRIHRHKDPLVRLAVLRERTPRVGSFTLAAQFFLTAGILFLVPVFVQTTLGYDALESGLTLLPATAMLIVAAAFAARLVGNGRLHRKPVIIVGFLLIAAGALLIGLTFDPDGSGLALAPGLALVGLGIGLCTILSDLVQSSAPPDAVSDVAGLSRSFSYLGQSMGVALAGAVMVGVLVSSFASGIRDSQVLTTEQKMSIEQAVEGKVQATAVSDDQVRNSVQVLGVAGATGDEIVGINAHAREAGLTAAMLAMAGFALAGGGLALRLPSAVQAKLDVTS